MNLIVSLNKKVKNMDIWDIGLTKLSMFFSTLCLVSLIPVISTLDWYIYLIIALIFSIRPMIKFFGK
ncbi:hypothetical protein KO465_04025 [Candidatus Micrarchaeota archaeon]|nr:hypothetical protein [Candidatus Micrarchaeota archaeon]